MGLSRSAAAPGKSACGYRSCILSLAETMATAWNQLNIKACTAMSDQWRSPVTSWILAARLHPRYQLSGKASLWWEPWTRRAVTGAGRRERGGYHQKRSLLRGDVYKVRPLAALLNKLWIDSNAVDGIVSEKLLFLLNYKKKNQEKRKKIKFPL